MLEATFVPRKKDSYQFFVSSLRRLMDVYEGQYVAVVGRTVVAHGKDAEKVYERARRTHPVDRILIGQVPAKEAVILWDARVFHSRGSGRKRSE
jgi:hypothetical protein